MSKSQDDFYDDYTQPDYSDGSGDAGEQPTIIQVKVSDDKGATWHKYDMDVSMDLDSSGLKPGQLLIMNSEKYEVFAGEYGDIGLRPYREKRQGKRR